MSNVIKPGITLRIERGRTRAFPYIADTIAFHAMALVCWSARSNKSLHDDPNLIMACRAADLDLHTSMKPFLSSIITGELPERIDIATVQKILEPPGPSLNGMKDINTRLYCAQFSVFADAAIEWMRGHAGSNYSEWPPAIGFGRVVRNAIVHGGTINIQSPNAPATSWRGLTYSHTHYGREIINRGDLSLGDLIVLMLEMEIELNDLEAPTDLTGRIS